MHFMSVKKIEKTFWFCDLFIQHFKNNALAAVKGDAKFQNYCRYVKRLPFVNQKVFIRRGVPFQSKGVYKRVRVRDWPYLMKTFKYLTPR